MPVPRLMSDVQDRQVVTTSMVSGRIEKGFGYLMILPRHPGWWVRINACDGGWA